MTELDASEPRTVLVVDDNQDAVTLLARVLQRWGHTVHTAHDGGTALEEARRHPPHVVFLDIGLPDMDGYAVAEALRAEGSQAVLVALTGYGHDEDRARAEAAGFAHHLLKPVDLANLKDVLARL